MNKTVMYLQADMHRAINSGNTRIEVSILDLKELIGQVMSDTAKAKNESVGVIFGFIRKSQLDKMRKGQELYCSIRRKKNDEYCEPVYCDLLSKQLERAKEVSEDCSR